MTPCYNEEGNVRALYEGVKQVFAGLADRYTYEHIFIDNASKDGTVAILKEIAAEDRNVKIIVNARNFGHIRSPYHAMLQARGDAVHLHRGRLAGSAADDPRLPPQVGGGIQDRHRRQDRGRGVSPDVRCCGTVYYKLVARLSDVELTQHVTGFGLYDRRVIEVIREIDDPYPYFRGLIADIGFESHKIPYKQPQRKRGITKNNFYTLYDMAMLGITNHSKVPLRVATMAGFVMSAVSLLTAVGYLAAKLIFWGWLEAGVAPILISLFFFSSVQMFFLGMLGRIHRRHPHAGAEASAGRRARAGELRAGRRGVDGRLP